MEIKFFVPCVPPRSTYQAGQQILKTKQGRWFIGKSSKGRQTANYLRSLVMPYRPREKMDGFLKLRIDWIFPFKKTEKKANIALGSIPCNTKPDADNLAKGIIDALQGAGYMEDDSRIYDLHIRKYYSNQCGIGIHLTSVTLDHYLQEYNQCRIGKVIE